MLPDSADESETPRNGLWSTTREVHATALGAAVGLAVGTTAAWELGALFVAAALGIKAGGVTTTVLAEVRREPWYSCAAFAVFALAGWGIVNA